MQEGRSCLNFSTRDLTSGVCGEERRRKRIVDPLRGSLIEMVTCVIHCRGCCSTPVAPESGRFVTESHAQAPLVMKVAEPWEELPVTDSDSKGSGSSSCSSLSSEDCPSGPPEMLCETFVVLVLSHARRKTRNCRSACAAAEACWATVLFRMLSSTAEPRIVSCCSCIGPPSKVLSTGRRARRMLTSTSQHAILVATVLTESMVASTLPVRQ